MENKMTFDYTACVKTNYEYFLSIQQQKSKTKQNFHNISVGVKMVSVSYLVLESNLLASTIIKHWIFDFSMPSTDTEFVFVFRIAINCKSASTIAIKTETINKEKYSTILDAL